MFHFQIKHIFMALLLVEASGEAIAQTDTLQTKDLDEVVVTALGAQRNLKAAEIGLHFLNDKMITRLPVMFGEPDIIKSLQVLPGVSQGVEGFTGLYVRGGDNDQNLFLYQGLPLYHVSHLGGIFSSFNVSTVNQVDFFKASFPAQYGGRISSITDVKMKRPNFDKFTGRFSLGLLSANGYISGPIVKDKTAFSVGVRRSWMELVTVPTLAILNATKKKNGEKKIGTYNFMDFNARLDHRFNNNMSAYVMGYYGHDYLKMGDREFEGTGNKTIVHGNHVEVVKPDPFFDESINKLSWGNWGMLGAFDWALNVGRINVNTYYSNYHSNYEQSREYQSNMEDISTYGLVRSTTDNGIYDIGVNGSYDAFFNEVYRLKAGVGFIHHNYLPEWLVNESIIKEEKDTDDNKGLHMKANEAFFYLDNTLNFGEFVTVNAGVRGVMYHINQKTHTAIEPRVSARVRLNEDFSVKAGYARMNQFAQQISNNYINLPTDLWQPTAAYFKPLRSDQYSLGLYGNMPLSMYFSVEGWYKDMRNLLEYRNGISVLNSGLSWEEKLTAGKGWSYGVDFSVTKELGKITGSIGYGLMWNWRKFDELNQGMKYPAKFDNRHKLNINVNYWLNKKVEFNAGWTYMTGNRMSLALYNYDEPGNLFPDAPTEGTDGFGSDWDQTVGLDYYSKRNNVRMPAYHRLDLSVSLHKQLGKGREGVWNFGLYNTYCRMNAMTIKKDFEIIGNQVYRKFQTLSMIPVIPSVSYTYKF